MHMLRTAVTATWSEQTSNCQTGGQVSHIIYISRHKGWKKTPPLWMVINLSRRLCWCGKPKKLWDKYRRKFCSGMHSDIWHYHVIPWWPTMRSVILERDDGKCAVCGHKNWDNEVDHIVPKATDPDMFWYEDNLHVLCKKCHYRKTGKDIRNINIKKRGAKHVPLSNFFLSN